MTDQQTIATMRTALEAIKQGDSLDYLVKHFRSMPEVMSGEQKVDVAYLARSPEAELMRMVARVAIETVTRRS